MAETFNRDSGGDTPLRSTFDIVAERENLPTREDYRVSREVNEELQQKAEREAAEQAKVLEAVVKVIDQYGEQIKYMQQEVRNLRQSGENNSRQISELNLLMARYLDEKDRLQRQRGIDLSSTSVEAHNDNGQAYQSAMEQSADIEAEADSLMTEIRAAADTKHEHAIGTPEQTEAKKREIECDTKLQALEEAAADQPGYDRRAAIVGVAKEGVDVSSVISPEESEAVVAQLALDRKCQVLTDEDAERAFKNVVTGKWRDPKNPNDHFAKVSKSIDKYVNSEPKLDNESIKRGQNKLMGFLHNIAPIGAWMDARDQKRAQWEADEEWRDLPSYKEAVKALKRGMALHDKNSNGWNIRDMDKVSQYGKVIQRLGREYGERMPKHLAEEAKAARVARFQERFGGAKEYDKDGGYTWRFLVSDLNTGNYGDNYVDPDNRGQKFTWRDSAVASLMSFKDKLNNFNPVPRTWRHAVAQGMLALTLFGASAKVAEPIIRTSDAYATTDAGEVDGKTDSMADLAQDILELRNMAHRAEQKNVEDGTIEAIQYTVDTMPANDYRVWQGIQNENPGAFGKIDTSSRKAAYNSFMEMFSTNNEQLALAVSQLPDGTKEELGVSQFKDPNSIADYYNDNEEARVKSFNAVSEFFAAANIEKAGTSNTTVENSFQIRDNNSNMYIGSRTVHYNENDRDIVIVTYTDKATNSTYRTIWAASCGNMFLEVYSDGQLIGRVQLSGGGETSTTTDDGGDNDQDPTPTPEPEPTPTPNPEPEPEPTPEPEPEPEPTPTLKDETDNDIQQNAANDFENSAPAHSEEQHYGQGEDSEQAPENAGQVAGNTDGNAKNGSEFVPKADNAQGDIGGVQKKEPENQNWNSEADKKADEAAAEQAKKEAEEAAKQGETERQAKLEAERQRQNEIAARQKAQQEEIIRQQAEQKRQQEEEAKRQRAEAEAKAKAEAERQTAEAQRKAEEERRASEEAARQLAERMQQQAQQQQVEQQQ